MKPLTIYIASSWKNQHAVEMLTALLRERGHTVNSFVDNNFGESLRADGESFEDWLKTDRAMKAFKFDTDGATKSDLVIYISPSGKDAACEVGMAWAAKIPIFGLYAKGEDFGLMRKCLTSWDYNYKDLLASLDFITQSDEKWDRFHKAFMDEVKWEGRKEVK